MREIQMNWAQLSIFYQIFKMADREDGPQDSQVLRKKHIKAGLVIIFLGIWNVKSSDFLPFRLPSQRREKREEMIRKRGRSRRKLRKMEEPVILIPSRWNLFLLHQKCKKQALWSMFLRFVVYSYMLSLPGAPLPCLMGSRLVEGFGCCTILFWRRKKYIVDLMSSHGNEN